MKRIERNELVETSGSLRITDAEKALLIGCEDEASKLSPRRSTRAARSPNPGRKAMQSLAPWLAMLLSVVLIACSDDESSRNPPRDGAPTRDDAMSASCPGSPSIGCEEVVDNINECPRLENICRNVCGAAYDCCYCEDGQWTTLYIDCAPCPDAAIDAY
jgi:hypothetical protein